MNDSTIATGAGNQRERAPDQDGTPEPTVVIDPHIWKKSGLSREEFLKRVKRLRRVRLRRVEISQVATELPVFSYFPGTLQSWELLERFHGLVNKGDFSVFDDRTGDFVVALIIGPKLASWLFNTNVATLQLQVLNWLAAWLTFHSEMPDKRTKSLPPGILEKVEELRRIHYGKRFSYDEIWNTAYPERPHELLQHYAAVSKTLTGAAPPEILRLRRCEVTGLEQAAWGLAESNSDEWIGLDFCYDYGYIRDDDWERYFRSGDTSDLDAAESCEELRQKWLLTLQLYPTRKSHLFSILAGGSQLGFVYVLRGESSGLYKIGFTAGSEPYGRMAPLQTGASERLAPVGHFCAASLKTEATVKRVFAQERVRPDGEWFALSPEDVSNLLDEQWRVRNNIF